MTNKKKDVWLKKSYSHIEAIIRCIKFAGVGNSFFLYNKRS